MNEAWTGPELQAFLQRIDYWSDTFTARELELMYRAEHGDFNWMYDKDGFPRSGYIKFWMANGELLQSWEWTMGAKARAFGSGTYPARRPRKRESWEPIEQHDSNTSWARR